ncbi:hypothetical protein CcaverHIS002_0510270 [Cutaneotrichosporon cavernicola]|nr:hypothetical protein CcaverHIS002_0510270 [Cutaneotrichosporon cavernicola]
MPRRRFSTPARPQQPAPLRHTLMRARSDEGWMLLERDEFEGYLPAAWSADTLPLSRQPTIEALARAFVLDSPGSGDSGSLSSVEVEVGHQVIPVGHPAIPVRTSSLEIVRHSFEFDFDTCPSLDIQEVPRRHPDVRNAPAKFVYKTPAHIILERDCFPFRPAIMIQAPTPPRTVSGSSTSSAPPLTPTLEMIKPPTSPQFPLVPSPESPAAIASIPSLSSASLNSLPSLITPQPDPTPRELAERSERVQTLSNAVMRSRAYSGLMHRYCETLGSAFESAVELQEARAEIARLQAKVVRYRDVNRSLVDWGLRLREENEVLRAEAGEAPGVALFDPERDMLRRDDEGYEGSKAYQGYEVRPAYGGHDTYGSHKGHDMVEKGNEEDSWRIDEREEYEQQGKGWWSM